MNERIKELVKQATAHATEVYQQDEDYLDIMVEKFAELLINECAQVSEDDITDGDACCTNTAYRIAGQIKKHFGVE